MYETSPTGDYYEYVAFSIGDRSQPARTYLERHYEKFEPLGEDELVLYAVKALAVLRLDS